MAMKRAHRAARLVSGMLFVLAASAAMTADEGPEPLEAHRDFHSPDSQLSALIDELLYGNPEILAARELAQSRYARVAQARSLPDPQVAYRLFLNTPETRVGPQNQGVEITQAFPWSGKRELQASRAGHAAGSTAWQVQSLERALVAELKRTYFDAAYLQEALEVNAEEAALLRRFEQIALTRYSTGEGIQQNVIKVQTDVSRLADQRTALDERFEIALRRIAELLGRTRSEVDLLPVTLTLPALHLDTAELEDEAVARNPGIFANERQIESDRAWIKRRQRDALPDFALGLGYTEVGRRDDLAGRVNPPQGNGKDIWALTVKLNIPLQRERIRAGVAEAEHSLQSGRHALGRTRERLRYGVQESVLRLRSVDERARLYRDVIVPQAGESLASSEAAYTTNRQGFLDLLDAERVLFQVRLTYHRLVSDYWIALANLERTIARPFPAGPEGLTREESTP